MEIRAFGTEHKNVLGFSFSHPDIIFVHPFFASQKIKTYIAYTFAEIVIR